jgi:hypothetical protein
MSVAMKRIMCLLAFAGLFAFTSLDAQDAPDGQRMLPEDVPHLKFMGIPVDGSPLPMLDKLQGKGFTYVDKKGGVFILTGTFSGVENCAVGLTTKENFVWKVSVSFPSQLSWNAVKAQYEKYKNSYIDKYQIRPEVTEKLSSRFREGTGQEHWGFEDQASTWQSVFYLPEGFITLAIMFNRQQSNLFLVVDYVDKVNYIMKEQIDMEDI